MTAGGAPCPSCGKAVRAGARFCGGCGATLAARCPGCGAPVEDDSARFCELCGSPLAAPTASQSSEQRPSIAPPAPAPSGKGGGAPGIPRSFGAGRYEVSRFLGADRGYVLAYDLGDRSESMTHE